MLRLLFRLVMLAVVAGVVLALYVGYRWMEGAGAESPLSGVPLDVEAARRAGAEVAGKVAAQAGKTLSEAGLTAKIRSKMALDDTIDAGRINVDTSGTVVTVSGSVATAAERQRVLQLVKETAGVTSVVDRVEVTAASKSK